MVLDKCFFAGELLFFLDKRFVLLGDLTLLQLLVLSLQLFLCGVLML